MKCPGRRLHTGTALSGLHPGSFQEFVSRSFGLPTCLSSLLWLEVPLYRGPRLRWLQRGFVEELLLLPEMPCLFQGLAHQVQMAMIMTQSLDVKLRLWQRDDTVHDWRDLALGPQVEFSRNQSAAMAPSTATSLDKFAKLVQSSRLRRRSAASILVQIRSPFILRLAERDIECTHGN